MLVNWGCRESSYRWPPTSSLGRKYSAVRVSQMGPRFSPGTRQALAAAGGRLTPFLVFVEGSSMLLDKLIQTGAHRGARWGPNPFPQDSQQVLAPEHDCVPNDLHDRVRARARSTITLVIDLVLSGARTTKGPGWVLAFSATAFENWFTHTLRSTEKLLNPVIDTDAAS
jgi:hypothetical protein